MSDLIVKGECKSVVRQCGDQFLNWTFPFWGVLCPFGAIVSLLSIANLHQNSQHGRINEMVTSLLIALFTSFSCLILKQLLSCDRFYISKNGIRLPRFIGNSLNPHHRLSWSEVESVSAKFIPSRANRRDSAIMITSGNRRICIPISGLQPDFLEQFLLAARMWAGAHCDESLDRLQEVAKENAHHTNQSSYTELWEEELGRRFCPTSYIPLEVGKVLRNNTLKIVSHLSSGGLSALYLCQLNGKELVVLKEAVVPEESAGSVREKAIELFDREAALLMKLDHANIVHVVDCFTEQDRNYLLLEYVSGVDLRQLVTQNGPQKESDVLDWSIQVAQGLKYLHEREQPVVHRDLTPDNIVLRNDGKAIIVDFGAANELIGTATGTFVGKHAYIAPEQLRGKATTHSDIYAFGCTLFFLLTGKEPLALSSSNPREHVPEVSEEFAELIETCTQLECADRYQSVAQMLPVLRRLAAQSVVV